jgi:hypothetical protein
MTYEKNCGAFVRFLYLGLAMNARVQLTDKLASSTYGMESKIESMHFKDSLRPTRRRERQGR